MSLGAVFTIFKCAYFIPVSCLINIAVLAAAPSEPQALDLMWVKSDLGLTVSMVYIQSVFPLVYRTIQIKYFTLLGLQCCT